MATREEIADILAGFTLFGDLQTPQLLGVASIFDEVVFPSGERILRQGLTGSGFYVILDGTADVRIDGQQRATLGRGDFFGEVSILLGEPPTADVVATARSGASRSPAARSRASSSRTPRSCTGCSRRRRVDSATPTAGGADRGRRHASLPARGVPGHRHRQRSRRPAGLVRLKHYGVQHAVLSADPSPGGMFRRWPFFQRLLSWTKPYAPEERIARVPALRLEQPDRVRARAPVAPGRVHGRLVVLPVRPEVEASLTSFADKAGIAVRYDCRWERTRRDDGPDGPMFTLETTDGEYRTRVLVLAVGIAEPWTPKQPGIEHARHYAETREASTYAGKRLFIIGKQNSGFELASGLAAWASKITVASPSPAKIGRIIAKAARIMEERKEELAQMLTREEGKTISEARGELTRAINVVEFCAGESRRMNGETIPSELPANFAYTIKEPHGVVACITPWNFPIAIPAWKIAPALVAGNTVVFKPATITPGTAALLTEIFNEAGLPTGVLNLVLGSGSEAGDEIVNHPAVRAISFTGSNEIGIKLYQQAAARGIPVQAEMGGKNPVVVLEDCDMELAVESTAQGAFGSTGQRCTATSRAVVVDQIADEFVEKIVARAEKLQTRRRQRRGDPHRPVRRRRAVQHRSQIHGHRPRRRSRIEMRRQTSER